jgi:hypothetical protein
VRISQTATNEHPMLPIIFPSMQDGNARPVEESGAFASLAHREALPILRLKQERFSLCCFHWPANPIRRHDPDRLGASQPLARQEIHDLPARCAGPGCAPLDRICHHPGKRYLGIPKTCQHASGQFRFGLEADRVWDASRLTAITVRSPVQGQGKFAGNSRMPLRCDRGDYVE